MHFYGSGSDLNNQNTQCNRGCTPPPSILPPKYTKSFVVFFGEIFMAGIDLRGDSKSFGKTKTAHINAYTQVSLSNMIASGFQVMSNEAWILYFLDTEHIPQNDVSINPLSCGIDWPLPIGEISSRDKSAISLEEYIRMKK
jgi:dTDP-4-dehydrorhamnose 3,5-epimerase-like enzyme